jgi:leucine dehydrogenase
MIDPGEVIGHPCDVFVPCAVGRLVDADSVGIIRCALIAGAANDVLSTRAGADLLRAREIDYVPDFLINSGGVIAIHAKRAGWDEDRMTATVGSIGTRVRDVLRTARDTGRTPLEVAEEMASAQLGHRVTVPD